MRIAKQPLTAERERIESIRLVAAEQNFMSTSASIWCEKRYGSCMVAGLNGKNILRNNVIIACLRLPVRATLSWTINFTPFDIA